MLYNRQHCCITPSIFKSVIDGTLHLVLLEASFTQPQLFADPAGGLALVGSPCAGWHPPAVRAPLGAFGCGRDATWVSIIAECLMRVGFPMAFLTVALLEGLQVLHHITARQYSDTRVTWSQK